MASYTYAFWFDKLESFPLLRALHRAGHLLVLSPGAPAGVCKTMGVPYEGLFLSEEGKKQAEKELHRLNVELGRAWIIYEEGTWRPFVQIDFENMTRDLVRTALTSRTAFLEMVKKYSPKVLVQGVDCRAEGRPLVEEARRIGVPSLQVQHGSLFDLHPYEVAGEATTVYSDYVCAWGEKDKNVLLSYGCPEGKIILTGCPYLDHLYKTRRRYTKADARQKLGIKPDEIVVSLWSSHPEPTFNWPDWLIEQNKTHWELVDYLKGVGGRLVACPHPLEVNPRAPKEVLRPVVDSYLELVRTSGFARVQVELLRKTEAMIASDVCIFSLPSSAILDAMILEVPVVLAQNFPGVSNPLDGALISSGLVAGLERALTEPSEVLGEQAKLLPYWNYGNDGKATERVVKAIDAISQRKTKKISVRTSSEGG